MNTDKCNVCFADKHNCERCQDNPKYRDYPHMTFFIPYKPVCPIGAQNCINDPGYLHYYHPRYYKELYGNKPPEKVKLTCTPDGGRCDDYDDEDK